MKKKLTVVAAKEDFTYSPGHLWQADVMFTTEYDGMLTTQIQRYHVVAKDAKEAKARAKAGICSYGDTPQNLKIKVWPRRESPSYWVDGNDFTEKVKK